MTARPRVLVVGPGPHSLGGVWSAIDTLLHSPLADAYELQHVATHRDGSAAAKLRQAATGIARAGAAMVRGVDMVWIHSSADASFRRKAVVATLARLTRTPYVFHSHTSGMVRYYEGASGSERAVVRRVLRSAALVVALGDSWERALNSMAPCVSVRVMNPVDVPADAGHGVGGDGPVLVTGRVGDHKGSRVLVEALALVADRHPGRHLVLAGDGDPAPVRELAARLGVSDRVTLTGWVDGDRVARLLDEASVFALPSRDEGMPMALLEAMARGVPCIVTPVGGIPDLVADGEHVLFVAPDDPRGLADALDRLWSHPDEARAMGERGRQRVRERCSTTVVAGQLDECFRQILGDRPGRP